MMKAVNRIVHEQATPEEAFEFFNSIRAEG